MQKLFSSYSLAEILVETYNDQRPKPVLSEAEGTNDQRFNTDVIFSL
jgi:hypothetical protein